MYMYKEVKMKFGIPEEAHTQQGAKQFGYYDTKKACIL